MVNVMKVDDLEIKGRFIPLLAMLFFCIVCIYIGIKDRESEWFSIAKQWFMISILATYHNYMYLAMMENVYNKDEIDEWLDNNIKSSSYNILEFEDDVDFIFVFMKSEDAMAFKLRWM